MRSDAPRRHAVEKRHCHELAYDSVAGLHFKALITLKKKANNYLTLYRDICGARLMAL